MDKMCEVALGVIGASLTDFMTWEVDDYVNAVRGYRIKMREYWEMVRWTGYYSVVAMNGTKDVTPSKIWIPTDPMPTAKDKPKAKWRKLR